MLDESLRWLQAKARELEKSTRDERKRACLREARIATDDILARLRDLDEPRQPIHTKACRILILYHEGGLFEYLNADDNPKH